MDFKKLFVKSTKEDKSNFHAFQRLYEIAPKHYVIKNCTEGFIALIKRSGINYDYLGYPNTIEILSTGGYREIECNSKVLAAALAAALKGEQKNG